MYWSGLWTLTVMVRAPSAGAIDGGDYRQFLIDEVSRLCCESKLPARNATGL